MMKSYPGERTIKNLLSVVDTKIEQFRSKFNELRSALQERAVVQTEIAVLRVLETVENISLYLLLLWVVIPSVSYCVRRCRNHTR
jgi:hypothetical protein